jgi:hypothetical protein
MMPRCGVPIVVGSSAPSSTTPALSQRRIVVADGRAPELVEHTVETMLMQRSCGIALGYEDLVDHDELYHDRVLATLVGKLEARRKDCAPLAVKSTFSGAIARQRECRQLRADQARPAPRPKSKRTSADRKDVKPANADRA